MSKLGNGRGEYGMVGEYSFAGKLVGHAEL